MKEKEPEMIRQAREEVHEMLHGVKVCFPTPISIAPPADIIDEDAEEDHEEEGLIQRERRKVV
ncbi:hypothetical protein RYX45_25590, partial [Alkalihalophilus pseudofirmus]